jgi:hypothetical protein
VPARSSTTKRAGQSPSLGDRLRGLPPWISAIAAVTGTLIAAIGVFGLVSAPRPPAETAAPPTAAPTTVVAPRVTIESVLVGSEQLQAQGAFEFLDPAREEILLIGRPSSSNDDLWVAVEAALTPRAQQGSLQSGEWTASRPAPPTVPYRWRVIVWPNSSGAAGNEDLQLNGPDSEYVIARSEEWLEP